jgi:hypothetical protein
MELRGEYFYNALDLSPYCVFLLNQRYKDMVAG